jgi:hypothetical protein
MTLQVFFARTNRVNLSETVPEETNFIQRKNVRRAGGKGEEFRLQSQEGQELSADAGPNQLTPDRGSYQ